MLKRLDRYIIWNFLTTFLFTLGLFILVVIVVDLSEKIDNFVQKDGPSIHEIIFDYYFNFLPYFINLFSPLFIFIAAIYFTSRMAYGTEFIAMFSSGVSFYRLLMPYLFVGFLMSGASFYMHGYVIPEANKGINEFRANYILHDYHHGEKHIHRQLHDNIFMYMESFDVPDTTGYRFALEKFKDDNSLNYKIQARKAVWNYNLGKWIAVDWQIRYIDGMNERVKTGDSLALTLPIKPKDFGRKHYSIRAMTNPELREYIAIEKLRGESEVATYQVQLYQRSSMPFATVVMVMLAFSLASRKIRGGMGLHLGLGILIAFSYILFLQLSTTFATEAGFSPLLAVWIPNIIFFVLALILIYRAPK